MRQSDFFFFLRLTQFFIAIPGSFFTAGASGR